MNLHIYSQLIFNKDGKPTQWEKNNICYNHTDTLDIHMQEKMNPDPYLTPYTKSMVYQKHKTLKKNRDMGINLHDPGFGKRFLLMIPRVGTTKFKTD